MITSLLHRMVAISSVYDLVQQLAGARQVRKRLAAYCSPLHKSLMVVLDLGAGTGLLRDLWPPACCYICLDVDRVKLRKFQRRYPRERVLYATGTSIPLRTGCVDVVVCSAVFHHVPPVTIGAVVRESARVLKSGGKFIVLDAVWEPACLLGRLLWKCDRGAYPRTANQTRDIISNYYTVVHWERFALYHEYVLCVAKKNAEGKGGRRLEMRGLECSRAYH